MPPAPPGAAVDTKRVRGRRVLSFRKTSDVLAEAERLVAGPTTTLGNWSLGQILMHLARSTDLAIDGTDRQVSWTVRMLGRYVFKRRLLTRPMPAGYQLPGPFAELLEPGETTPEAGLKALREAQARSAATTRRAPHPALGPLSRQEWDQLHLRHAEHHLSFVLPQ